MSAIRSADLGEPQRRLYIVPREIPVPPNQEESAPVPEPVREPEPERVA
jgi:hypothetical protein